MKYELYKTKDSQYVNVITREDVLKSLVSAKAYISRHYKNGLTINEAIKELAKAKCKKIIEEELKEKSLIIVDVYAIIKNAILNKKIEAINMVLNVYEYIYGFSFASMDEDFFDIKQQKMTMEDILNRKINVEDFSMDSDFINGLAANIYNNYNNINNIVSEEEYLKIEREFLDSKKSKKRK